MTDLEKAEILERIRSSEAQVRHVIKEAEEKRKQLQAEGKRKAIERSEAADASLRKEVDSKIAGARMRIEAKKRVLLDEGARKAEQLKSDARKRMGKAEEFVLSEFERAVDA